MFRARDSVYFHFLKWLCQTRFFYPQWVLEWISTCERKAPVKESSHGRKKKYFPCKLQTSIFFYARWYAKCLSMSNQYPSGNINWDSNIVLILRVPPILKLAVLLLGCCCWVWDREKSRVLNLLNSGRALYSLNICYIASSCNFVSFPCVLLIYQALMM